MLSTKEQVAPVEEVTKSFGHADPVDFFKTVAVNQSSLKTVNRTRPVHFRNRLMANIQRSPKDPTFLKHQNTGFKFRKIACQSMASDSNSNESNESPGYSPRHKVIRVSMVLPNDPVLIGQENIPTYRIVQKNSDSPAKVVKTRKFGFLTQRRKEIAEKYIDEILPKANNVDLGEFGSLKWCSLLLDRYHAVEDHLVTIDCIKHWVNGTPWGRKISKAYEAGRKAGGSSLVEYERMKSDLFCSKRKKLPQKPRQPDPGAVDGFLNDHDYCKNTWLEDALKEICSSNVAQAAAVDDLVNFLVNDNSRSSTFDELLNNAGL